MSLLSPKKFIAGFLTLVCISCSTSKNKFLNREYHTLNTRYNVLFNGKEALAVGEEILEKVHEDNFFELLPVEPITLKGENFDDSTIVPGFDRAEEKAVKAIQKHSMNIGSVQYNRQIDAAYLLLGKARYYDRRFFPALEAFNFLLVSETTLKTYNEGRIWKEKTNIRLNNNDLAIENLRPLANSLQPYDPNYSLCNATLSEAFINKKQLDSASFYMDRAAQFEKKKSKKARYLFISGQLYEALSDYDAALLAYYQIITLKRKVPKKFNINARLKSFLLVRAEDTLSDVTALDKMLKIYENNAFKHSIYRTMANYYRQMENDSLTLHYLKQSLESPEIDRYTRIYNYTDLIDLNFNRGNYLSAGSYLDTLIPLYPEKSLLQKRTQRKRNNLEDVIAFEGIVKETDSLLFLMGLSKEEQLLFFENDLNKKREAERLQTLKDTKRTGLFFTGKQRSNFYFYNPSLVVKGKQQYLATWGNRPNVDNWRSARLLQGIENVEQKESKQEVVAPEIVVETPENFVKRLAQKTKNKDSIIDSNHQAYLQLGMIYKEKYKNNPLAINRLTHLMEQSPVEKYAAPALYHLFKIHEGNTTGLANKYKERLIQNHPETIFAKMLRDPENFSLDGVQTPKTQYEKLYEKFLAQEYEAVIEDSEALAVFNSGNAIEPKFKLLKANAIGRLQGVLAWKVALEEFINESPKTPEGELAKSLVDQLNATDNLAEKGKKFKNYKWVYPFLKTDTLKTEMFYNRLTKGIKDYMPRWRVSFDSYDAEYNFIVVHGIRNRYKIDRWLKNEVNQKEDDLKTNYFVVLAHEFRSIIKNKTWKAILNTNEE